VANLLPAFRDLAMQFGNHVSVVNRRDPAAIASAVVAASQRTLTPPADISAFTWDAVTDRLLDLYRRVAGVVPKVAGADGQHLLAEG
jgi:hypothetical protein